MDICGVDAQTGIHVAISGCTELRAGRRCQDRAAVKRRHWITNVGTVIYEPVVVAVKAVLKGERSAGLKRGDAGNRPARQGAVPAAGSRSGDIPYVSDREPVRAVIIAWPVL